MAGDDFLNKTKIEEYAANAGKVGTAIAALFKHDGWQIFLALYNRRRKEILERSDYATIEAFKADRLALDIIDSLVGEMEGFVEDADAAAKALVGISGEETPPDRGIMLIEAMEDSNRES